MDNLDHLIPESIVQLMQLNRFDFVLDLMASPCNNRWPKVKVTIGTELVFDDYVIGSQQVKYNRNFNNINDLSVFIEYYNKQDDDTLLDASGQISENQSVIISGLIVNGIDLIKTQIIYNLGMFYQNLSAEKQQYYVDNGFNVGPSHTLHLCENGIWRLKFQFPVMQQFVKHKAVQLSSEQWPNPGLLSEIYTLIQDIRKLTK